MKRLLIIALLVAKVAAEDGKTELALNVFSDLAPVLALFGEQFATQFASQSLTWLDHVIFAMVPLGIITIISGAIRVAGPQAAKAVIGRARESRAVAEAEVMSSISHEVCEVFNGRSIVRAIGKPNIAHFLIFPRRSGKSEIIDRPEDESGERIYGIHTLKTAHKKYLIRLNQYHSESYKYMKHFMLRLQRRESTDVEAGKHFVDDIYHLIANTMGIYTPPSSVQRLRENLPKPNGAVTYPDPPNIQLNISKYQSKPSMKEELDLILAAVIACMLQLGLICVAAVTVFHQGVKNGIGVEPEIFGFPCYVVGSVLLSVGIAVCSLSIEQATGEQEWMKCGETDKDSPQLIFLQKGQRVQDMKFDPYVIFGGRKYRIITSRRGDELSKDAGNGTNNLPRPEDHKPEVPWELITIIGAAMTALGFTAQFIGLRGLAYPCAIAHLLALILMAAIRAVVRRRLGYPPTNTPAIEGHELDFLSVHLVFCTDCRKGEVPIKEDSKHELDLVSQWEIRTMGSELENKLYVPSSKEVEKNIHRDSQSERLLRVRKRLGDLSRWKTKASPSALSLVKSIEAFMETFFPKKVLKVNWIVEVLKPGKNGGTEAEFINIPVSRTTGSWEVDVGKIAAVLSLWIAKIEAKFQLLNTET